MATPTLVSHTMYGASLSLALSGSSDSGTSYGPIMLPKVSTAGNLLICSVEYGTASAAPSVTDSTSTSWTAGPNLDPSLSTNGQGIAIFYRLNCPSGVTGITVSFGSASSYNAVMLEEWNNVATVSGVYGGVTSTAASRSITATVTVSTIGDVILQFVNGPNLGATSTTRYIYTPGASAIPYEKNRNLGMFAQSKVTTASGSQALTASFTTAAGTGWNAATVVLKAASSGGMPSGIQVVKTSVNAYRSPGTSQVMDFPTSGNLFVLCFSSNGTLTAVSDSINGAWTQAGTAANTNAGNPAIYFIQNATAGAAMTITATISGSPVDAGFTLYDISGAASSAFDLDATNSNLQGSFANLDIGNINCSTANGLVIAVTGIENNSLIGTATSGGVYDPTDNAQTNGSGGIQGLDGAGHVYNSASGNQDWTWTTDQSQQAGGVNHWASVLAAFKAPGISAAFEDDSWRAPILNGADPISSVWQ